MEEPQAAAASFQGVNKGWNDKTIQILDISFLKLNVLHALRRACVLRDLAVVAPGVFFKGGNAENKGSTSSSSSSSSRLSNPTKSVLYYLRKSPDYRVTQTDYTSDRKTHDAPKTFCTMWSSRPPPLFFPEDFLFIWCHPQHLGRKTCEAKVSLLRLFQRGRTSLAFKAWDVLRATDFTAQSDEGLWWAAALWADVPPVRMKRSCVRWGRENLFIA